MVLSLNWIGQVDLILTCIHLAIFLEKKNSWLHVKNKVADENLHSQRQINFRVKLQCLVLELLFISYFDFRKQSEEFFFSKQKNSSNENRSVQDPQDVQFPVGLVQNKRKCKVRKFLAPCLECCCNCCRTRKHTRFGLIIAQNSHLSSLHTRLHGPSRPKWASGLYYALVGKYICTSVLDMKIH